MATQNWRQWPARAGHGHLLRKHGPHFPLGSHTRPFAGCRCVYSLLVKPIEKNGRGAFCAIFPTFPVHVCGCALKFACQFPIWKRLLTIRWFSRICSDNFCTLITCSGPVMIFQDLLGHARCGVQGWARAAPFLAKP
eukprot:scaffold76341_cov20-Tisochrysis_lutea.AAC.1